MVEKGRWVVLLYLVVKGLPGLRLIPPGVKEERYRRPQWLVYYIFSNLNSETLPIAAMSALSAMQYGRSLERLVRGVVIANPALGAVHFLKACVSDVFYRIVLRLTDAPNLGLGFPLEGEYDKLVVIPLTLPMEWKNSRPIFCTATDTVADLENAALRFNAPALLYNLDYMFKDIFRTAPPNLQLELAGLTSDPYLRQANA